MYMKHENLPTTLLDDKVFRCYDQKITKKYKMLLLYIHTDRRMKKNIQLKLKCLKAAPAIVSILKSLTVKVYCLSCGF